MTNVEPAEVLRRAQAGTSNPWFPTAMPHGLVPQPWPSKGWCCETWAALLARGHEVSSRPSWGAPSWQGLSQLLPGSYQLLPTPTNPKSSSNIPGTDLSQKPFLKLSSPSALLGMRHVPCGVRNFGIWFTGPCVYPCTHWCCYSCLSFSRWHPAPGQTPPFQMLYCSLLERCPESPDSS